MLTGSIRAQVDRVWDSFRSGGISNSPSVIEQFTYVLSARRLEALHTAREAKANLLKEPIAPRSRSRSLGKRQRARPTCADAATQYSAEQD